MSNSDKVTMTKDALKHIICTQVMGDRKHIVNLMRDIIPQVQSFGTDDIYDQIRGGTGVCLEEDEADKLPPEFNDMLKVLEMGAKKYEVDGWLKTDKKSFNDRDNHASMSRHLAEYYMGVKNDEDSDLDPLLHLATRALMAYTRRKRGIRNE